MSYPATIIVTLQVFRVTREAWGVATVLIHSVEGEVPKRIGPGTEVSAVGDRIGLAAPGERLTLRGEFEATKYGQQFRVAEQSSQGIQTGDEGALWLRRLDKVGPVLARRLFKKYGDDLPRVLAGEIEAELTEVEGIGADMERHIRESFAQLAIAGDLEGIRYLDGIKASRFEASKILKHCAKLLKKPKALMESEPYSLMTIKGLGFIRVDRLARAAGCAPAAPARLEAATTYQIGEMVSRGSTMVRLCSGKGGGLVGEVLELLGLEDSALAFGAVDRLAAGGSVVKAADGKGHTWIHPSKLLAAEREIYRAAKGKASRPAYKAGDHWLERAGVPKVERKREPVSWAMVPLPGKRIDMRLSTATFGNLPGAAAPSATGAGSAASSRDERLLEILGGETWED